MNTREQDNIYLNRDYAEVMQELILAGIRFRTYRENGINRLLTRDYDPDRLNFDVYDWNIQGVKRG